MKKKTNNSLKRSSRGKKLWFRIAVLAALLLLVAFSEKLFGSGDVITTTAVKQPPSLAHPFGTDNLGRDLLSRSFIGLRLSLLIAAVMQVICLALGMLIGSVCGYYGGIFDKIFTFLQNVILSFPGTVMTLCIMMLLGNSIFSMLVALCIFGWLSYARLTRSQVIVLKSENFIRGEIAIGSSPLRIHLFHIAPNIIRTLIPMVTLMIGHSVLAIAGLCYLGFGVQPPQAEIGVLIQDGMIYIRSAPWMFIFPGLILTVYSIMFNVVGDGLQDYLNPHNSLHVGKM